MQHLSVVYLLAFHIPRLSWVADLTVELFYSVVPVNTQTDPSLLGSTVVAADLCFRLFRAAMGFEDRKNRL